MIIQLKPGLTEKEKSALLEAVAHIGYKASEVQTQFRQYLVCVGKTEFDIRRLGTMPGVDDIHRVSDPYKLVSRKWRVEDTAIDLGDGPDSHGY